MESRSNKKAPHPILINFIINKINNKQWLHYAREQFFSVPEITRPQHLEPKDFVFEVTVFILGNTTVVGHSSLAPVFELKTKTKTLLMSQQLLKHHIFLQIKSKISHAMRAQSKFVRIPENNEIVSREAETDDEIPVKHSNVDEDFTIKPDDPFDETLRYKSKEFIEIILTILEKKNTLYKIIFDDKLSGLSNIEIAQRYKMPVHQVENNIKKIFRYLRNNLII